MTVVTVRTEAALSCEAVTVTLDGARVVDDVSLAVPRGGWLTLVGPNGAGKTTLLRALAGLVPSAGTVRLDGEDTDALDRRAWARRVGLVPQVPTVPPGMTVAEYVLLGRTPHLGMFAGETADDLDIARDALQRLELLHFASRAVESLSGGERQRVVVARLLAQQSSIALLDEPTTALDVGHQQQVLDLVDALRADTGLTVVATMHDLTLAGQYGDELALLVGGRLVASGPAADVLTTETLGEHYGARVRVMDGPDGPIVVPIRELS